MLRISDFLPFSIGVVFAHSIPRTELEFKTDTVFFYSSNYTLAHMRTHYYLLHTTNVCGKNSNGCLVIIYSNQYAHCMVVGSDKSLGNSKL